MVIDGGWSSPQAARTLGLPADQLKRAITEHRAENAIDAAEIDMRGMSKTTKLALYSLRQNEELMREVADLVKQASLTTADLKELVSSLNDATSPEEAKAIFEGEREQRQPEIQASEGGLKQHPVREKYAKALNNLRRLLDDKKKLKEFYGELRGTDDPLIKDLEYMSGRLLAVAQEMQEPE